MQTRGHKEKRWTWNKYTHTLNICLFGSIGLWEAEEKKKGGGSYARERKGGARTVKGGAAWIGAEQGRVWQPTGSDLKGETGTHTVKHETFSALHFWCSPLPHE